MQNPQDVWNRIQETKQEHKNITTMYKDALENSHEYRELTEKIKELAQRKKQIETETKNELGSHFEKLQSIKKNLQLDKELLSDITLSSLMKGEAIKITDREQNDYEPVFSVRFRKSNVVDQKAD